MQTKVLRRTIWKIGTFIGAAFLFLSVVTLSAIAGQYFFNEPVLGIMVIGGSIAISGIAYFSYKEAKYEVDRENRELIRELTKHG